MISPSKKAFSLIELLVALSILAIVAAIIVPRFIGVRRQAIIAVADQNIAELNNQYQQWVALGGTTDFATFQLYPASLAANLTISNRGASTDTSGGRMPPIYDTPPPLGSNSIVLSLPPLNTTGGNNSSSDPDGFVTSEDALYYKIGDQVYPITLQPVGAPGTSNAIFKVDWNSPQPATNLDV